MKKTLFLLLVSLSIVVSADVLQIRSGMLEGVFSGYNKFRIQFQAWDGNKVEI